MQALGTQKKKVYCFSPPEGINHTFTFKISKKKKKSIGNWFNPRTPREFPVTGTPGGNSCESLESRKNSQWKWTVSNNPLILFAWRFREMCTKQIPTIELHSTLQTQHRYFFEKSQNPVCGEVWQQTWAMPTVKCEKDWTLWARKIMSACLIQGLKGVPEYTGCSVKTFRGTSAGPILSIV